MPADNHNFGQKTRKVVDGSIFKPRCCFYEWMILDKSSPFRRFLEMNLPPNINLFQLIPSIDIKTTTDTPLGSGYAQSLQTPKAVCLFNFKEIELLGALLAFTTAMGISDLHPENVLMGRDHKDNLSFVPVDIECIFQKLVLPAQTNLMPYITINKNSPTAFDQLLFLQAKDDTVLNLLPFIRGYVTFFTFFNSFIKEIINILNKINIQSYPIRVVLRDTRVYKNKLNLNNKDKTSVSFFYEEKEQLRRGDIPYFVRYLNDNQLYWQISPNQLAKVNNSTEVLRIISDDFFSFFSYSLEEHFSDDRNLTAQRMGAAQIASFSKLCVFQNISWEDVILTRSHQNIILKINNFEVKMKVS